MSLGLCVHIIQSGLVDSLHSGRNTKKPPLFKVPKHTANLWKPLWSQSERFHCMHDNHNNPSRYFTVFTHSYEIHLSPEVRRKGLGKFLIQILELIGHRQVP